ncbi:membrane protein insertion efficiency factor YidD [bacterium]|nr:membrane protein insertion efficiency factor YidD [bacterium]
MLRKIKNKITHYTRQLLIAIILGVRPFLGPTYTCRFVVSCTDYAIDQLETEPIFSAIWNILKRLCMCNPFYKTMR